MNYQVRYKAQKTDCNSPYLDQQTSSAGSDLPIQTAFTFEQENPSWLKRLLRLAEIKSLMRELTPTLASPPSNNSILRFVDKLNPSLPSFKIEDLKIIGYTAYICEECLVSHPLTLYWNSFSMKPVPTMHICNNERIIEVQQKIHKKKEVTAELFGELLDVMFLVVKQWTSAKPMLKVAEIPSMLQGLQNFKLIDNKNWGIRAIRNRFTILSDEKLADFLNLAKANTYAYFKMKGQYIHSLLYVHWSLLGNLAYSLLTSTSLPIGNKVTSLFRPICRLILESNEYSIHLAAILPCVIFS
jgi:hypothetical protein